MPAKTPTPDLRFVIHPDTYSEHGTLGLVIEIAYLDHEDGKVKFPQSYSYDGTSALSGLAVHAHMRRSDDHFLYTDRPTLYSRYSITANEATAAATMLRRIETKLGQLNTKLGYVQNYDLAAFLARLAIAVGTKADRPFGRKTSESWDGTGYRWMDANDLQWHLEKVVREFKEG